MRGVSKDKYSMRGVSKDKYSMRGVSKDKYSLSMPFILIKAWLYLREADCVQQCRKCSTSKAFKYLSVNWQGVNKYTVFGLLTLWYNQFSDGSFLVAFQPTFNTLRRILMCNYMRVTISGVIFNNCIVIFYTTQP